MVLKQIGGADDSSPWTLRRDDGTPTASDGDFIICDGGTVTLPTPQQGAAVAVGNIEQRTTITAFAGQVEFESEVGIDNPEPAVFVSDGSDWFVANDLDYVSTIPDSVVSRQSDTSTSSDDRKYGLEFSTSQAWPNFQAKISSMSSGFTTAYIHDVNFNMIQTVNVSNKSAGDVVTFTGVNLSAGQNYGVTLDAGAATWTYGQSNPDSHPTTSSDGNLTIEGYIREDGNRRSDLSTGFVTIGNINL